MKDIITEYRQWHIGLSAEQKDKFDFISQIAYDRSEEQHGNLFIRYSFREELLVNDYFKNYNTFWKDEVYNATHAMSGLSLTMDYGDLSSLLKNQIALMRQAVSDDQLRNMDEPGGEFLDDITRFQSQFYCLLWFGGLMEEYLKSDIDAKSDPNLFDISKLRQFDKIIDLLAQITHYVDLFFFKETGNHRFNPRKSKVQTFENLFRDKKNAQKVKEILESNGYTENGQWTGESNKKSELMYAYYVLKPILHPGYNTSQVRVFYKEFGLPEDHISDRQKTNKPDNENKSDFERIFSRLILN